MSNREHGRYDREFLMKLDQLSLVRDDGESARGYLEMMDLEADWHIFKELRVGSLIRLTRGARTGVVVDTTHFERKIVSVIFADGSIEKLSLVIWLMLGGHYLGHHGLEYSFESDAQVNADYSAGVFTRALHQALSLTPPDGRQTALCY